MIRQLGHGVAAVRRRSGRRPQADCFSAGRTIRRTRSSRCCFSANFTAKPLANFRMTRPTRRSDRRVEFAGYRNSGRRDVDDEAGVGASVGERQECMRDLRHEPRVTPQIFDAGVLLLLEPGQFLRHPGAPRPGHLELHQEAHLQRRGNRALEFAEVLEIGDHALADLADDRHVNDHAERRDTLGAAGERPELALAIVPARQRIAAAHVDVHCTLPKEL